MKLITAVLFGVLAAASTAQDAPPRSATAIVADFDSVNYPSMSEGSDPASLARFTKAIADAAHRQEACALELLESHPDHARVPELLRMRWQLLVNVDHDRARVRRETEPYVGPDANDANGTKAKDARLVPLAHVLRAWACVEDDALPASTCVADLECAVQVASKDFLARTAFLEYAQKRSCDPAFQRDVLTRVAQLDIADGGEGADARRWLKLLDRIGQPWLGDGAAASSAVTQPPLDLAALHGHPVLVSFFPTPWNDRERREAASLASLAKEFGEGGLEFVVVHTLYSQDDVADRRKHLATLALPGRGCFEVRGDSTCLMERSLGIEVCALVLLLDPEGKVVALSAEAKSLRPAVARLAAAKGKRRPI